MSEQSAPSTPVEAVAAPEAPSGEVQSLDMDSGAEEQGSEEAGELEGSEETTPAAPQATEKQVDAAADKFKAKEVKGSDGDLFKIKVDGQEIEVKREEMVRLAQMGKAGQRAMQEKAELQKSMASFVKALRENPALVLKEDLGIDVTELSQQVLAKQMEEDLKSPEQKRVEEMERKLAEYERQQKESEEKRQKDEFEAEVKRYEKEIETQVMEAFNNFALPHKPIFLNRMADLMQGAYERNLDVTPNQIAKLIKEDWIKETREAMGAFDDKALEDTLGTELLSRLRKSNLKKVKSAPSVKAPVSAASIKPAEAPKAQAKINMKDFLRGIGKGE